MADAPLAARLNEGARIALGRAVRARCPDARRAGRHYAALAAACSDRLRRCAATPWTLGIQGPQGSGKTTLATALAGAFEDVGVRAVSLSIDDFYCTYDEQCAVSARHPNNPYLRYRGQAGTHDVALGTRTLRRLLSLLPGEELRLPTYDKSAYGGRGDRAPVRLWRSVTGPIELLILEGWLLGFAPVPDERLDFFMRVPNGYLREYAAWTSLLDALVHLDVESLGTIVSWRVDAERARRAQGKVGLSDEDARDYIERFIPAYRAYVPCLQAHPPCDDFTSITLGEDRAPLHPLPSWSSAPSTGGPLR